MDRALADVTALESYDVVATVRADIFVHLIGLSCIRKGLRVAIVYADLEMGELGRCLAEFGSMTGYPLQGFANRAAAGLWLDSSQA